jgi:hypothetical protein
MENPPAANRSRSRLTRFLPLLMVLLVILLVGFIRFRLRNMPLERDEGEYAYAGQLILQGIPPYELACSMKLPGTYYAYALGMAIFGETSAGVHLTLLAANALTVVFVFLLGRKLLGTTGSVVACASYGVMSASIFVQGMAAHANHFVTLFAVPATLLLLRADERGSPGILFTSGLLYGLAFLMKQQGICFCFFAVLFLIWRAVADKSILSGGFFKNGLLLGLGISLPFALFCLMCLAVGNFGRFWFWTYTYACSYVTAESWPEGWRNLILHLQENFKVSLGFWSLAVAGLPLAWWSKALRQPALFVTAFWVCSFLGAAAGLYFRSQYFILVLPAFALLVGMAVVSLQRMASFGPVRRILRALPLILFGLVFIWFIFCQSLFFFQVSALRLCRFLYKANPFEEAVAAAQFVREHSAPDARIAVMGSEPEIYFYAHRHSATGYIYTYPLMESQPAAPAMQREMMREIEASRPEYIVTIPYQLSWLVRPDSDQTILNWMWEYVPKLYDKVGIVGYDDQGGLVCLWNEAVTNAPPAWVENIRIYRRKTEPMPAANN